VYVLPRSENSPSKEAKTATLAETSSLKPVLSRATSEAAGAPYTVKADPGSDSSEAVMERSVLNACS